MHNDPAHYDPLKAKAKAALSVSASFVFGLALASQLGFTDRPFSTPSIETEPQVPVAAVRPAMDLSEAFVNIAETVTPAVVRIETRRQARRPAAPDALRRFFRDQTPQDDPPGLQTAGGEWFHRIRRRIRHDQQPRDPGR